MINNINTKAIQALKGRVKRLLKEYYVGQYDILPELTKEGFKHLRSLFSPLSRESQAELEIYLGKYGINYYVFDFFAKKGPYNKYDNGTKISEIFDIDAITDEFISGIESLPYSYDAIFDLPIRGMEDSSSSIEIAPGIIIWQPSEEELSTYPFPDNIYDKYSSKSTREGLLSLFVQGLKGYRSYEWLPGNIYLKLELSGYLGQFGESPVIDQFNDKRKAFLGCCLATGIFKETSTDLGGQRILACYFRRNNNELELVRYDFFNYEETVFIKKLNIPRDNFIDPSVLLLARIERKSIDVNSEETAIKWFLQRLQPIKKLFEVNDNEQVKRILISAQWYYDSNARGADVLGFIQAITAIESLLGDRRPPENLTTLLANRCAYLIGNDAQEREEILKDFKEIYATRSKVLHRGARRLSPDEFFQWGKLQNILKELIKKEIRSI